jgi:hypothetical protein
MPFYIEHVLILTEHLSKSDDCLEYALIIMWELMDRHSSLLEGHEADVFTALLHVRYSNQANVSVIRDDPSKN